MTEYFYSLDEEHYKDDLEDYDFYDLYGRELSVASKHTVYRGEKVKYKLSDLVNPMRVGEDMAEVAYDISGEHSESWLDKFPQAKFTDAIKEFLDSFDYQPNFFTVKNIKQATLTITQIDPQIEYEVGEFK